MAKGIDEQELAAVKRLRDELNKLPPTRENRGAVAAADLLIDTVEDLMRDRLRTGPKGANNADRS